MTKINSNWFDWFWFEMTHSILKRFYKKSGIRIFVILLNNVKLMSIVYYNQFTTLEKKMRAQSNWMHKARIARSIAWDSWFITLFFFFFFFAFCFFFINISRSICDPNIDLLSKLLNLINWIAFNRLIRWRRRRRRGKTVSSEDVNPRYPR